MAKKAPPAAPDLDSLRQRWEGDWEAALGAWSHFTKLSRPRWCTVVGEERRERLSGSFAMIRLDDHAVVISLRQIHEERLEGFAKEILAHEIGHHVYAPGDLTSNARLMARIRRALPSRESLAPLVANLYTDLLINDRLQRMAGLDLAGVYRALKSGAPSTDRVWLLYMRIYETLWRLPPGSLVEGEDDARLRLDAELGARVVRAYAKDWLRGAGRFGALFLPYLLELSLKQGVAIPWFDTILAGESDTIPDGLAELDEDEELGALHPAEDPVLTGVDSEPKEPQGEPSPGGGRELRGGRKNNYRPPQSYVELMASLGVRVSQKELVMRYYRERALPHLIPFPTELVREAGDPLPEGLDVWDLGSPLTQIDWIGTLSQGAIVIPGVTTLERTYGWTEGGEPKKLPLDLYVGVDCSGSMQNPAVGLSYPVLAGTILALSALRTGAKVMACLSGEPGRFAETDGFSRSEREVLGLLTQYLGTGYAFGIERLETAFPSGTALRRPAHILVVSDSDLFYMLEGHQRGWDIARDAAARAGGGASAVLQVRRQNHAKPIDRLESLGWRVYCVDSMEELVAFAAAFARLKYGAPHRIPGA